MRASDEEIKPCRTQEFIELTPDEIFTMITTESEPIVIQVYDAKTEWTVDMDWDNKDD